MAGAIQMEANWRKSLVFICTLQNKNVAKILKVLSPFTCCASSHCFQSINISNFLLQISRSRSLDVTFTILSFVGKYKNVCPSKSTSRSQSAFFCIYTIRWQLSKSTNAPHIFCICSYHFRYIQFSNIWSSNSRSWCAFFSITPFHGKCQNLQRYLTLFELSLTVLEI